MIDLSAIGDAGRIGFMVALSPLLWPPASPPNPESRNMFCAFFDPICIPPPSSPSRFSRSTRALLASSSFSRSLQQTLGHRDAVAASHPASIQRQHHNRLGPFAGRRSFFFAEFRWPHARPAQAFARTIGAGHRRGNADKAEDERGKHKTLEAHYYCAFPTPGEPHPDRGRATTTTTATAVFSSFLPSSLAFAFGANCGTRGRRGHRQDPPTIRAVPPSLSPSARARHSNTATVAHIRRTDEFPCQKDLARCSVCAFGAYTQNRGCSAAGSG